METKKSKTVFIEYSSSAKGQHFITVMQNTDGQRQIIGRIFREYDEENKKPRYRAEDWAGNAVFVDIKELPELKKKFIEHGKNLAMIIPKNPVRQMHKDREGYPFSKNNQRGKEIKQIREKKTTKDKSKEVLKTNPDQKEKEQDSKNPTKYKDTEQGREVAPKENVQEPAESNSEKSIQEEPEDIRTSEREAELDQIRDDGEDREQEMEIDM